MNGDRSHKGGGKGGGKGGNKGGGGGWGGGNANGKANSNVTLTDEQKRIRQEEAKRVNQEWQRAQSANKHAWVENSWVAVPPPP